MFGADNLLGGATPFVGGGLIGLFGLVCLWFARLNNRMMDRGEKRENRQWDQTQRDLDRKDREIEAKDRQVATLNQLLIDERRESETYRNQARDRADELRRCQDNKERAP